MGLAWRKEHQARVHADQHGRLVEEVGQLRRGHDCGVPRHLHVLVVLNLLLIALWHVRQEWLRRARDLDEGAGRTGLHVGPRQIVPELERMGWIDVQAEEGFARTLLDDEEPTRFVAGLARAAAGDLRIEVESEEKNVRIAPRFEERYPELVARRLRLFLGGQLFETALKARVDLAIGELPACVMRVDDRRRIALEKLSPDNEDEVGLVAPVVVTIESLIGQPVIEPLDVAQLFLPGIGVQALGVQDAAHVPELTEVASPGIRRVLAPEEL